MLARLLLSLLLLPGAAPARGETLECVDAGGKARFTNGSCSAQETVRRKVRGVAPAPAEPGRTAAPAPPASGAPSQRLEDAVCCGHNRYVEAVDLFQRIERPTGRDLYLAGFALIRLHQMDRAVPLLEKAAERGFSGIAGWTRVPDLLARAAEYRRLRPPLRAVPGARRIRAYAPEDSEWSRRILAAVPSWERIGEGVFGEALPAVELYLFEERPAFERFYAVLLDAPIATSWQDATGDFGVVAACSRSRGGAMLRPLSHPDTLGNVFHEFGHAWMNSYVAARHNAEWLGARRTPLLDEGLSDLIASFQDAESMRRREYWVTNEKVRRRISPPGFDDLLGYRSFYQSGNADLRYWLSALLMERVLGRGGGRLIPRILDEWAKGSDAEAAVNAATGKSLRAEYDELVRAFWPRDPDGKDSGRGK